MKKLILILISLSLIALHSVSAYAPEPLLEGKMSVATHLTLSPVYEAYGSGTNTATISINASFFSTSSPVPIEITSSIRPNSIDVFAIVNGSKTELQVSIIKGRYGSQTAYDFTLPRGTTGFSVLLQGWFNGFSFLWRYVTSVPSVSVSGAFIPSTYTTVMSIPRGNQVSHVFDFYGKEINPGYELNKTNVGTYEALVLETSSYYVLIQSDLFFPVSLVITAAALASIFFVAAGYLNILRGTVSKIEILTRRIRFGKLVSHVVSLFTPRKLLLMFLAVSVLMVSLSVVTGPDPRVKAYVIASPSSIPEIEQSLSAIFGKVVVVSPSQDYTDFGTMSSLGQFQIVVVSDYPSLALPSVSQYVLPYLTNVPLIVIDNKADSLFSSQIATLYQDKVVNVNNAGSLTQAEMQEIATFIQSSLRHNVLGLHIGTMQFKIVLALEGLLSFVLIFLGWAYLGSILTQKTDLEISMLMRLLVSGIFVFVFSEIVYVQTSSALAFPLSLHAVISGAKDVTAVGLLGFGGGSTPRLLSGLAGIVCGAMLPSNGFRIRKEEFVVLVCFPLILIVNPTDVGSIIYQSALLFVSSYAVGSAYAISLYFKGFLYSIGSSLGSGVSQTYLMSAGKILYFAGLAPLAFIRRMGRTTASAALLICSLMLADGGIRVGEMTPDKTFVAVLPGIVAGMAVLFVFLLFSYFETKVRKVSK